MFSVVFLRRRKQLEYVESLKIVRDTQISKHKSCNVFKLSNLLNSKN